MLRVCIFAESYLNCCMKLLLMLLWCMWIPVWREEGKGDIRDLRSALRGNEMNKKLRIIVPSSTADCLLWWWNVLPCSTYESLKIAEKQCDVGTRRLIANHNIHNNDYDMNEKKNENEMNAVHAHTAKKRWDISFYVRRNLKLLKIRLERWREESSDPSK